MKAMHWPIAAICVTALLGVTILFLQQQGWETDFLSFWSGAKLLGTPNLYGVEHARALQAPEVRRAEEVRAYIRPPFYAALLWPLSRFPYRAGLIVWTVLNGAAVAVFFALWGPRPLSYPLGCLYFPLWISFAGGQDPPIILVFFAWSAFLLSCNRDFAAGLVFALCGAKYNIFLLVPVLIIAKQLWRFTFGMCTGAAILLAASFALDGWDWPLRYYRLLLENEHGQASQDYMPNLLGLFHGAPAAAGWIGVSTAAVIGAMWYLARCLPLRKALAVMLAAGIIVSPHAFISDLVFLLPLILDVAGGRQPGRAILLAGVIGAASLTLTSPSFSIAGQLAVTGVLALVVLDVHLQRHRGSPPFLIDA